MELFNVLVSGKYKNLTALSKRFGVEFRVVKGENDRILFHSEKINGMIVERIYGGWRCVCYPLPGVKPIKTVEEVHKGSYKIFKMYSGTAINLHFSHINNAWIASTRRALNILTTSFRGHCYADLLAEYLTEEYLSSLDEEKTYNFIFTCPELHYLPKSFVLIAESKLGCAPEFKIPQEEKTIEEAIAEGDYVLRSKKNSYIVQREETAKRNSALFDQLDDGNTEHFKEFTRRNLQRHFVEAKAFVLYRKDDLFGEYKAPVEEKFVFLDSVKSDFVSFVFAMMNHSNDFVSTQPIDIQILYEDFFKALYPELPASITRETIESTMETLYPILFYHDVLIARYGA